MPRASTRFSIAGSGLGFGAGGAAALKKGSLAVPGLSIPQEQISGRESSRSSR